MSYIWKHIICIIIIILYHPLSTSQSEWIALIPSPLTADNSSKHSCWLWIYESCLYLALQGYPSHFIVMYMYRINHRPQSSHAAVINTKLPVLKIYVVVAYLLYCMYIITIPHHTNRYRVEIKYTTHILLCIIDERTYANRYIIWIVAYFCRFDSIVVI